MKKLTNKQKQKLWDYNLHEQYRDKFDVLRFLVLHLLASVYTHIRAIQYDNLTNTHWGMMVKLVSSMELVEELAAREVGERDIAALERLHMDAITMMISLDMPDMPNAGTLTSNVCWN